MESTSAILFLSLFLGSVCGHGMLTKPSPRPAGSSFGTTCGSQLLSQQSSDSYGNIQGEMQVIGSSFDASKCNLWLCKGYQFADNTNIQSFAAGETVPITFDIRAPHTGVANMSIVDTATNTVIGDPLISWDVFASNSIPTVADQLNFDITIPSDLGGKCTTAGECVIQHFWDARSIDQTYESCIDFTVSGSSSGSGGASSSSASSSVAVSRGSSTSTSLSTGPSFPAKSTTTAPIVTSPGVSPTVIASPSLSVSASATTNIAIPTDTGVSGVASTNTFTTTLPLPTGTGQKYICYVDE